MVGGFREAGIAFGAVALGFGLLAAVLVDRFRAVVVVVGDAVGGAAEVVSGMSEGLLAGIWVLFGGRPRLRVMEVAVVMVEVIV